MAVALTVGDIMTTSLITKKAADAVELTEMDMHLADIRHIPVVDDTGNLIGILSNRDILKALGRDFYDDSEVDDSKNDSVIIGDIMTTDVYTIRDYESASTAAKIMLNNKIGALPVIGESGQLIGLVTETDFLEIAYKALSDHVENPYS
ncbi:MAG: CBS domain-containing protein [Proteobacteria bacterium]|nr:CBS domain-containing protein [Pseudomonadota bacterium]